MNTSEAFEHLLKILEQDRTGTAAELLNVDPQYIRVYRQRFKNNSLKRTDRKGDKSGISEMKMAEILKLAGVKYIPENWKFPKKLTK